MSVVTDNPETLLFAYGTLRRAALITALIGRLPAAARAWLPDHAVVRLRGTPYPCLRPRRGAVTPGTLYRGLAPDEWQRLDRYEGARYRRRSLRVTPQAGGAAVAAAVYLLAPACRGQSGPPWRFERPGRAVRPRSSAPFSARFRFHGIEHDATAPHAR
ncbi:MAG: gamma-glutamylcyclotransferase [Pseudomonadales bacterium]|nr:gamma-glutamylcyclotransferase [Pseudomonadales bacterium]